MYHQPRTTLFERFERAVLLTVAESHKVELTFGFGRERSHASVVYGLGFPGSDYP